MSTIAPWHLRGLGASAHAWSGTRPKAPGAVGVLPPHRLSIVVPMFDELDNAAPLIDAVQSALAGYPHPWELIVVDDGSGDGTGPALERRARQVGPHVRVVRLWRNFRQTAAVQAGIDAARGDVIVMMDGDLQNDPRDIPLMVERLLLEDLDLVAGWRVDRQDGFWLRRLPSMLANRLIRRATGLPFHDVGCSLKACRTGVLRRVPLYGEMHRLIPAWLATVTSPGRMAEMPVHHRARPAGRSKYGLTRAFRVLLDVVSMYFFLHFGSRPGHFFGALGLMALSLGSAILGYLGVLKLLGESVGGRPLLALGFSCVLGGLQFLTTGVLAELLVRVYFRRDGERPRSYHGGEGAPPAPDEGWHGPA